MFSTVSDINMKFALLSVLSLLGMAVTAYGSYFYPQMGGYSGSYGYGGSFLGGSSGGSLLGGGGSGGLGGLFELIIFGNSFTTLSYDTPGNQCVSV